MNRYRLVHVTEFSYDAPVSESYNEVRLRPLQDETQSCLSFRLTTDPPSNAAAHFDYFGNYVHRFNIPHKHRRLRVQADSVVLVQSPAPFPSQSAALRELPDREAELDQYYDYRRPTGYIPFVPALRDLVQRVEAGCNGTCMGFALEAMRAVHESFRYEKGATHVSSSVCDTLAAGAGVCQDFAHILLGVVRMKGLPARYVSGYLVPKSTAQPGASIEEVVGGQASHAWMEVFIPGAGWLGLDPTLGAPAGVQHVRLAYGLDYGDAAPVRGVYKGQAGQNLSVDVTVRPALDDEGNEHLLECAAGPSNDQGDGPAQQPQQQ
jgi:transglutaminase-like putative cysteine protease